MDSKFAWFTSIGDGSTVYLDRDSLEDRNNTVFDAYENSASTPPTGRVGYGWDHLAIGGDMKLHIFEVALLIESQMVLSHDYFYQASAASGLDFMQTSYVLAPVESYTAQMATVYAADYDTPCSEWFGPVAVLPDD